MQKIYEKLGQITEQLKKLESIDYESIRQEIAEYKLEKTDILEIYKNILHKQSRKERTRKLIRIGAVVQKKLGIDLSREIDFKEVENSVNSK